MLNVWTDFMKTDIKETEHSYELLIDLPGVEEGDIEAVLDDGYLTVTAKTPSKDTENKNSRFIRRERFYGSYSRTYYIGEDSTEEDIKAKFDNGTLCLTVPKKEAPAVEGKKSIAIEG